MLSSAGIESRAWSLTDSGLIVDLEVGIAMGQELVEGEASSTGSTDDHQIPTTISVLAPADFSFPKHWKGSDGKGGSEAMLDLDRIVAELQGRTVGAGAGALRGDTSDRHYRQRGSKAAVSNAPISASSRDIGLWAHPDIQDIDIGAHPDVQAVMTALRGASADLAPRTRASLTGIAQLRIKALRKERPGITFIPFYDVHVFFVTGDK